MTEDFFERGIAEIIELGSFKKKLNSGKKLRIKMGFDPTRPDLHIGHAVGMRKLRALQDAGHTIVFIVGDYTTKIGDPSGKNKTRPILSDEEIKTNAQTYFDQAGKILDIEKTEIRYNSEWLAPLNFNDVLQLTGKFTVAQLIERDDFEKRLKSGSDLGLHETLYPVMQAYDSVMVKADVEFGGTDQKFNLLAGRGLQKKMDQIPQDIIMVQILVGLDGKEKMSKSLDNYVGITESANAQFGKIMSIPDSAIRHYFELATDISMSEIDEYMDEITNGKNPKVIKEILAEEIVAIYHGRKAAEDAKQEFEKIYSKKETPTNIQTIHVAKDESLLDVVSGLDVFKSKSEARRKIQEGAVRINGEKILDLDAKVTEGTIQAGKHNFYEIKWKN